MKWSINDWFFVSIKFVLLLIFLLLWFSKFVYNLQGTKKYRIMGMGMGWSLICFRIHRLCLRDEGTERDTLHHDQPAMVYHQRQKFIWEPAFRRSVKIVFKQKFSTCPSSILTTLCLLKWQSSSIFLSFLGERLSEFFMRRQTLLFQNSVNVFFS